MRHEKRYEMIFFLWYLQLQRSAILSVQRWDLPTSLHQIPFTTFRSTHCILRMYILQRRKSEHLRKANERNYTTLQQYCKRFQPMTTCHLFTMRTVTRAFGTHHDPSTKFSPTCVYLHRVVVYIVDMARIHTTKYVHSDLWVVCSTLKKNVKPSISIHSISK